MTAVGVLLVAMLVLGTVDTLVWLPEHLAPTTSLDGIYAGLTAADDMPFAVLGVPVWIVFWAVLGTAYVLLLLPGVRALRPAAEGVGALGAAALGCLLLGAVGVFHWWSAFGMGMAVSDDLPPGVGGTTPFGVVLALGGVIVGLVGVVLGALVLGLRARTHRSVLAP